MADDIKLYILNAGSFTVSMMDWLEPILKITLLAVTIGYTAHKWWNNPDPIKENKSYKDKSNVERTETVNEDGTKTVSTTTYRKFGKHKGEVKLETDTDFKDGVGTGSQRIVKTKKSGEKKTKLATGRYQV